MSLSPKYLAELENVQDRMHVRVLACDFLRIDKSWNVANVRSSFWRFYINNRDGAGIVLSDRIYPLLGGRIHFIPAWVPFSCQCCRSIEHLYVHFELLGLPGPVSRQVFDQPFTLPSNPLAEQLGQQLGRAASIRTQDTLSVTVLAKSAVYLALHILLEQTQAGLIQRMNHATDRTGPVWPALQYIEQHLCRPIGNGKLAEMCGLSDDHFTRRFREIVGQTPAQFVIERRTAQAAQDLIFGDQSIDEISEQCGFASRFYFSRVFKRHMGISPAAYRRQTRV